MVYKALRLKNALLFFEEMTMDGYFVPAHASASGRPEIYINSKLSDLQKLMTVLHELTHLFCHDVFNRILFSCKHKHKWNFSRLEMRELNDHRKREFEALTISLIGIIPETQLYHASHDLFEFGSQLEPEMWEARLYIREVYKDGKSRLYL